jgi:hypothetical protein
MLHEREGGGRRRTCMVVVEEAHGRDALPRSAPGDGLQLLCAPGEVDRAHALCLFFFSQWMRRRTTLQSTPRSRCADGYHWLMDELQTLKGQRTRRFYTRRHTPTACRSPSATSWSRCPCKARGRYAREKKGRPRAKKLTRGPIDPGRVWSAREIGRTKNSDR